MFIAFFPTKCVKRFRIWLSQLGLAQDGQRGSVAANTNWVGNAEGVANAIGYANAAVATLAGVAVVVLAEQLIENMITENGKVGWKSEVVPEVLAGFAHGNSGFIELFSRLYEVYPQTKYLDILSSLVEYENSLYSEKDNNWIDLRKFSEVDQHKSQPIAWCHGAAGILLSRLTLYNAIKNLGETALLQQAIKDISLAKNKLIEDGLHAGFCLCHGNMGNLLILKRYAEIFDDKQVRSICDSRFEQILEFLNEENILPTELYNPGFMTGLSGIAYALLKYKMPKLPLLIGVEGIYDRNEV